MKEIKISIKNLLVQIDKQYAVVVDDVHAIPLRSKFNEYPSKFAPHEWVEQAREVKNFCDDEKFIELTLGAPLKWRNVKWY